MGFKSTIISRLDTPGYGTGWRATTANSPNNRVIIPLVGSGLNDFKSVGSVVERWSSLFGTNGTQSLYNYRVKFNDLLDDAQFQQSLNTGHVFISWLPAGTSGWFSEELIRPATPLNTRGWRVEVESTPGRGEVFTKTVASLYEPINGQALSKLGMGDGLLIPQGIDTFYSFGGDSKTTEEKSQLYIPFSGQSSMLSVYRVAPSAGPEITITSRINGSDGNILLFIPAATSGRYTNSQSIDNLSKGDKYTLQWYTSGSGVQHDITSVDATYLTDYGRFCQGYNGQSITQSLTSSFYGIAAGKTYSSLFIEEDYCNKMLVSCTASSAYIYVTDNSSATSHSLVLRKNGTNTTGVVNIPSGSTGWVTGSFNVILNGTDSICWQLNRGESNVIFDSLVTEFKLDGAEDEPPPIPPPYDGPLTITINPFGNYPVRIKHLPQGTPVRIIPPV